MRTAYLQADLRLDGDGGKLVVDGCGDHFAEGGVLEATACEDDLVDD